MVPVTCGTGGILLGEWYWWCGTCGVVLVVCTNDVAVLIALYRQDVVPVECGISGVVGGWWLGGIGGVWCQWCVVSAVYGTGGVGYR